jgi:hypothetical protein
MLKINTLTMYVVLKEFSSEVLLAAWIAAVLMHEAFAFGLDDSMDFKR